MLRLMRGGAQIPRCINSSRAGTTLPASRLAVAILLAAACARSPQATPGTAAPDAVPVPRGGLVAAVQPPCATDATDCGFRGPEAVRYDPEQDIYFVTNFNGPGSALDDNGFISRVRPDGSIEQLRFVVGGTDGVTLHAPRGMTIVGDTLWAADVDAVRGFHRRTGAPVATVSFAAHDVGSLNDVAATPDGTLYITDTGRDRVYRIAGRTVTVALADTLLGSPNGITWDAARQRLLIVPYDGSHTLQAWRPGGALEAVATIPGANMDGVEVLAGGAILVASQSDSALYLIENGAARVVARTTGRPADIGVDTRRGRVAVPYIALNLVEIYALPE